MVFHRVCWGYNYLITRGAPSCRVFPFFPPLCQASLRAESASAQPRRPGTFKQMVGLSQRLEDGLSHKDGGPENQLITGVK